LNNKAFDMRSRILTLAGLLFLLFCTGTECKGAIGFRKVDGGKYAWLLDQNINSIAQDKRRFLWIATGGGILRYDGAEFHLIAHNPSDTCSLADNDVKKIREDENKGGLWIINKSGLDYFDPQTGAFRHAVFREKDGSSRQKQFGLKDLLVMPGKVLCCSGTGIYLCEKPYENLVFKSIDLGFSMLSLCDYDDDTFLSANHEGLYLLDKKSLKELSFAPYASSTYSHSTVYHSRVADRIYIGNSIGTKSAAFRCKNGKLVKDNSFVPDNLHTVCDGNGKVLFGTNGDGLYVLEGNEIKKFSREDGLASNVVTALCCDVQGNLWLGHYRGGLMLNQKIMESFSVMRQFKMTSSIIPDEERIYIGTDSDGMGIYEKESGKIRMFNTSNSDIAGNNVVSMTRLGDEIWMAVYTKGLCSYNIRTGKFSTWSLENYDELYVDNNKTWVVRCDAQGRIWVGGPSLFLFSKDNHSFTKIEGLSRQFISAISFKDDAAYVSTRNSGIYKIDIHSLSITDTFNPSTVEGFPEQDIRFVMKDSMNRIWISTQANGLYSFDEKRRQLTKYDEDDGLLNQSVTTISEDEQGNLWMASMNGLFFYSPSSGHFANLRNEAIIPAQYLYSSSCFDGKKFYFGSTEGLVIFDSDNMEKGAMAETVTFTEFSTMSGSSKDYTLFGNTPPQIKLSLNDRFFRISYSVPEFIFPQSIRYSYRMKGLDKDWQDVGNMRTINFTGMKPGDYEFEVRYSYMDGSWSSPSSLQLSVPPHWYATWWARILWLIAALGTILMLLRFHLHQQGIKEEMRISEIEKNSIREVNKAKMDFFTRIIHDLRTPVFLINSQLESMAETGSADRTVPKIYMDSMLRNSKKVTSLINRLIDFRKLDSDREGLHLRTLDVADFCAKLSLDYKELCAKKDIDFTYLRPDSPITLTFDPEKLESIIGNLISNAFKYTANGGQISLSIEKRENDVLFQVKDSGIGIAPEDKERIFEDFYRTERSRKQATGDGIGLTIVKSLVKAHGGSIQVASELDKGSAFSFNIPFGLSADKVSSVIEDEIETSANEGTAARISVPNPAATHTVLVIDDDTETVGILERSLEPSYKILKAYDAEDGLKITIQHLPDLVICDLNMPGNDGFSFLQKVRQDHKFDRVKIIVLTGSNSEEDMIKVLEEGADAYLLKPVSLKELKIRIEKLLKQKEDEGNIKKTDQLFLMHCQEIIEEHLSEDDFNIGQMAEILAMSHSSLYKKIKAITGLSLIGFINDYKIHKAILLFRQGETNVTSVCEKCGFRDEKNFRDLFKRKTGLTPKHYVLDLNTKNTP